MSTSVCWSFLLVNRVHNLEILNKPLKAPELVRGFFYTFNADPDLSNDCIIGTVRLWQK